MPTDIYLVRHGETHWNLTGRLQGRADVSLSRRGVAQARRVGQYLHDLLSGEREVALYSSPLRRARQTAQIIARHLDVEYQLSPNLTEMCFGRWEGLSRPEIEQRQPGFLRRWQTEADQVVFPSGETCQQVDARASAALGELVRRHTGSQLVLVTHGQVIRGLLCLGLRLEPGVRNLINLDNGSVSHLVTSGEGNWRVAESNRVPAPVPDDTVTPPNT
ncbi:MAG: histidine phosphatase family protein [Bacillota bacterium]